MAAQDSVATSDGRVPDVRGWRQVRTPGVVVLSDASAKAIETLAAQLVDLRRAFSALWPTADADVRPVVVIALRDPSAFGQLLPDNRSRPRHARPSGVFVRGLDCDYLALGLQGPVSRWFEVLDHEYAHLLVDRHLERLPVWLDEGLAELVARGRPTTDAAAGRAAYLKLLSVAPILPIEVLLAADRSSPHYTDDVLVGRYYAQAWALTHYLMVADGGARADRVTAFIGLLRRGAADVQAAERAFGSLEVLQSKFVSYVRSGRLDTPYTPSLPTLSGARAAATPLGEADAFLWLGDFLEHAGQTALAADALRQAQASGAGPRAVERGSLSLLRQQRFAEAEAMADEAMRSQARLAVAPYVRAVATMAQSATLPLDRADRAERDLRTAIEIAPGMARAHAVLGGLLATARQRPQDGLVFARRAVDLAPSDLAHRIALAQVLLLDDQPAEARWLANHIVRRAGSESERAAGERILRLATEAEARLASGR